MRLAVIADIHGNLEAFEAVLADIDQSGADDIVSLGDNIGYGPDSDEVVRLLRERDICSVLGNHEIVVKSPRYARWFNPVVRQTIQKTVDNLSADVIRHICTMEPFLVRDGCRFVHGFPPKSVLLYLLQMSDRKLKRAFGRTEERLCFVGHTHELSLVAFDGEAVQHSPLVRGRMPLRVNQRYILSVGSVGQPRDGDSRAKYVIWDSSEDALEVRYIPYDVEKVAQKIIDAGYPRQFADRLR